MTPRWLPPGVVVAVTLATFLPTLGNDFASWAYREAMRLSGPRAPWGHLAIARLLEQSRLDAGARTEFAAALREDPTSWEACEGLERLRERQ